MNMLLTLNAFQMVMKHKYFILNITTNLSEFFVNLAGILQKGNPGKGTNKGVK